MAVGIIAFMVPPSITTVWFSNKVLAGSTGAIQRADIKEIVFCMIFIGFIMSALSVLVTLSSILKLP
jgi:hypothetical protein